MATINIPAIGGGTHRVDQATIECPYCHSNIVPEYLAYHNYTVFAECPNTKCRKHLVLLEQPSYNFVEVQKGYSPSSKVFSDTINTISAEFQTIYNEAFYAEQLGLNQICGVGYRKSLEFLIKDYLISNTEDEAVKERIKNKFLSNCIQEDIVDNNIKNVAKRAVWLGNDETHYVRKWADKDVSNLKHLIDLTVRWIENEVETKKIIDEMS